MGTGCLFQFTYCASDAIHASFKIWYIQDGVLDGSRQVLQTSGCRHIWLICIRPDALPDRAALYKHAYLNKWTQHACWIELHCTSRHIWERHRISRHVWYNATTVQVAPNSSIFHLHLTSKMSVAVAIVQQAWPIMRYYANRQCW